jgi:predicted flap endonuclease-1-like 5' DNA nuclease
MSNTATLSPCRIVCWGLSALIGLMVLLGIWDSVGFFAALMAAVALTAFIGLVATRLICTDESDSATAGGGAPGAVGGLAAAASSAGAAVAKKASEAASATTDVAKSASGSVSDIAQEATDKGEDAAEDAKESAKATARAAEEKVKSGTLLKGEEELANRKGEWSYDASGTQDSASAPSASNSGVQEDTNEGSKPEALSAPKGGKADNLKEIKGVGPKLETMLNDMGFYHFDQIANWGPEEVAWVDANIKGFKGRVSRDNWVDQAKTLASGGETEFSKRARDGDVY